MNSKTASRIREVEALNDRIDTERLRAVLAARPANRQQQIRQMQLALGILRAKLERALRAVQLREHLANLDGGISERARQAGARLYNIE